MGDFSLRILVEGSVVEVGYAKTPKLKWKGASSSG